MWCDHQVLIIIMVTNQQQVHGKKKTASFCKNWKHSRSQFFSYKNISFKTQTIWLHKTTLITSETLIFTRILFMTPYEMISLLKAMNKKAIVADDIIPKAGLFVIIFSVFLKSATVYGCKHTQAVFFSFHAVSYELYFFTCIADTKTL